MEDISQSYGWPKWGYCIRLTWSTNLLPRLQLWKEADGLKLFYYITKKQSRVQAFTSVYRCLVSELSEVHRCDAWIHVVCCRGRRWPAQQNHCISALGAWGRVFQDPTYGVPWSNGAPEAALGSSYWKVMERSEDSTLHRSTLIWLFPHAEGLGLVY